MNLTEKERKIAAALLEILGIPEQTGMSAEECVEIMRKMETKLEKEDRQQVISEDERKPPNLMEK